ncbi:MAG: HAD family hydrolase [Bryobacteraceae bacterium]
MMPLCIVLDLDDTLFLERDYVRSGFGAVGKWAYERFHIGDFAERAYQNFECGRRGDIFNAVLRECNCEPGPDDIQAMVRVYRKHYPIISLLPDAAEFLSRFRGVARMALISDGPLESQRRKFSALHLKDFFDFVVFTDIWGAAFAKPHPRAFQLIQHRLGTSKLRYIYVADNPYKDFDAPLALNWQTIRIRRAEGIYSLHQPSGAASTELEVSDLKELTDILLSGSHPFRRSTSALPA